MAASQPGKGLEYKVILSHVTDFEDWVSSGSGDEYEENLRVPFANTSENYGLDEPHASFFGSYKVRDPVTGTISTVDNHDDFGLLNQPYHYQDEIHPHIFDKTARGGTDKRDLEFELDVTSISHNWTSLASALNMPAKRPFTKGDDNPSSISNTDVGGMVYQLNALSMDLGSQSETITVQGVCIDRDNPPHQESAGAPHIRKQQLMDLARGQWAGNSGFQFGGDDQKDYMTPSFWLALTIGPVRDRTLQAGVFSNLVTSLTPVRLTADIGASPSSGNISITISDNSALLAGDIIRIDKEQFKVVDSITSSTVTTVTRAQNSTSPAAHNGTVTNIFSGELPAFIENYQYTEKYWTGDEPSDDIRGKERLRNEYQPGFNSPNTEQTKSISGTQYRVLSSGYASQAKSPAIANPVLKERKALTHEYNRYPAESEFWRDGWRFIQGFQFNLLFMTIDTSWGDQANNPVLRDWDYKFHYDGRSRYRGAIKNLSFTQRAGRPDVWDFNLTFMVVKNETRIRHLSTADDSAVELSE